MKCIVIETSPERINAKPVTNEDGSAHVYATISEARAELKANGYSYNRANDRYYIKGTEYRAYIIRENSEEYADAITTATAEEPEQTTAEIIAEQARDYYADTKYSAITAEDIEQADAYTTEHLKLTVEVMDALGIFHASDRMLVAIAQAMRWTLDDIEAQAIEEAHDRAAAALVDAYAEAIGDTITEDDPETRAAYAVSRACIGYATATDDDRATVSAMVEAIADRARETAAVKHYQTADAAARTAESFAEAVEWAADKIENDPAGDLAEWAHAARAFAAHAAEAADAARLICNYDRNTTFSDYETSAYAAQSLEYIDMRAADAAHAAARSEAAAARAEAAAEAAVAPVYQRYELLAYLGDPDAYDVEAIEAEATRYTADGARVWAAFGSDLAAIAERHEIVTYYAI